MSDDTFVYVMDMGSLGFIKVGIAYDVEARRRAIQASNPYLVRVAATFGPFHRGRAATIEKAAHRIMAESAARGEWFILPLSTALAVVSRAVEISNCVDVDGQTLVAAENLVNWLISEANK